MRMPQLGKGVVNIKEVTLNWKNSEKWNTKSTNKELNGEVKKLSV